MAESVDVEDAINSVSEATGIVNDNVRHSIEASRRVVVHAAETLSRARSQVARTEMTLERLRRLLGPRPWAAREYRS